ncbi:unnamed protein product, partial [marine sediment metagenome]
FWEENPTPWTLSYSPVRNVARLGIQVGSVT